MVPIIDVFKCDGCKTCIKTCPPQIMGLIQGKAALHVRLCEECGICADVCPVGAIIFRLPTKGGDAVHEEYRTYQ